MYPIACQFSRAVTVSPHEHWGPPRTTSRGPGVQGYFSCNTWSAWSLSIYRAGSQVILSYPVEWMRYCNWLRCTQECSTCSTWYSWSPPSSTRLGGTICCTGDESSAGRSSIDRYCTGSNWRIRGSSNTNSYGDTCFVTRYGPSRSQANFCDGLIVRMWWVSSHTFAPTVILGAGCRFLFACSSMMSWLHHIAAGRWSWTCCILAWTWSASTIRELLGALCASSNDIGGPIPVTAQKAENFVDSEAPLFAANSANDTHCTQSSCWWLLNTGRYSPIPAFIFSVCPSDWGLNGEDSRGLMPSRSHSHSNKRAANRGPWWDTIALERPCILTMSFRNNSANLWASIVIWHGTKCLIYVSLSTTTQITSNPSHSSNSVTNCMHMSSQGFYGMESRCNTPNLVCLLVRVLWHLA